MNSFLKTLLIGISLSASTISAQTQFWVEDFENSCATGCLASAFVGTNGAWTVVTTGANGSCPNEWFISCAENGNTATSCGSGCGSDESLHIANQSCSPWSNTFCPTGDCGAAYDAGNPCAIGSLECTFGLCICGSTGAEVISNRAAVSPVIDLTGRSGISIEFNYMENGEGTNDDATFEYFNGSIPGWVSVPVGKTLTTCAPQGLWTAFTFNFPASVDGRSDFQIRFNWTNDANTLGSDPTFAVDDVRLFETTPMPVELISFDHYCEDGAVQLTWSTASELNNDYFLIEESSDMENWTEIGRIPGNGNSNTLLNYSFLTEKAAGIMYYRLKQVDYDGAFEYFHPVAANCETNANDFGVFPNPASEYLQISLPKGWNLQHTTVRLISLVGATMTVDMKKTSNNKNAFTLYTHNLTSGTYLVEATDGQHYKVKPVIISH